MMLHPMPLIYFLRPVVSRPWESRFLLPLYLLASRWQRDVASTSIDLFSASLKFSSLGRQHDAAPTSIDLLFCFSMLHRPWEVRFYIPLSVSFADSSPLWGSRGNLIEFSEAEEI